jgi:hypothetical protein
MTRSNASFGSTIRALLLSLHPLSNQKSRNEKLAEISESIKTKTEATPKFYSKSFNQTFKVAKSSFEKLYEGMCFAFWKVQHD